MAIEFRNTTNTNLHDVNKVNHNGAGFSAVAFAGEPGSTLAVDTGGQAITMANGECDVNETALDAATYVAFKGPSGELGLCVAP